MRSIKLVLQGGGKLALVVFRVRISTAIASSEARDILAEVICRKRIYQAAIALGTLYIVK